MNKEKAYEIGRRLLERVRLLEKAESYPSQLSGGQQQRVAIAKSLAMNPHVMLFDEPTSVLAPKMIKEGPGVMFDLTKEGVTMLDVSHEMDFAKAAAHRVVFMDNGEIVEEGFLEKTFNNPEM